jgi:hypothetical protein
LALSIPVKNASFESPLVTTPPDYNHGPVTDWTLTGTGGVWNANGPAGSYYAYYSHSQPPPDGQQVAWLHTGSLEQTLADVLTANTNYTLTVDAAALQSGGHSTIELLAGGNILTSTLATPAFREWNPVTVSYTALAGDPNLGGALGIRFVGTGSADEVDLDNVRLAAAPTAVPEPGSLTLCLGAGLAGGCYAFRRRK